MVGKTNNFFFLKEIWNMAMRFEANQVINKIQCGM